MSEQVSVKQSGLNRKSYAINMVLFLPLLAMGRQLGIADNPYNDDFIAVGILLAQMISLTVAVLVILWTIKRLHDAGRSGWFSLFLIPPFTIFLLIYALAAPPRVNQTKWGVSDGQLSVMGIKPQGVWRIILITLLVLFVLWLWLMFYASLIS